MQNKAIKNTISLTKKGHKPESWGSLTQICDEHGFPYHTLKKEKYPFEYDGWKFERIPFREKRN